MFNYRQASLRMIETLEVVLFGSRTINYMLRRSDRKTVRVQVHPDGSVRVIAPLKLPVDEVRQVMKRKAPWIVKQLRYFEQFRPLTPTRQFRAGETHRYLGRQYRLKLLQGEPTVRLIAGFIEITLPELGPRFIEQALQGWYRQRAGVYFHKMLGVCLRHFESYDLPTPDLRLRHMPTRWGSCTPNGSIYINPALIQASGSCIEYVIVHELCHFVHRYHDEQFYALLDRLLPDWKRRKELLERTMA